MNVDIMEAITQIAKDKKIEKENLRDMLENIFTAMIQKKYGSADNFDVIVNIDKGDIEIYQEKTVVEEVVDPVREITLADALKIDEDAEIGEEIVEVIDPIQFGRRLIVSAKQNLNQRIRDFEKENLLDEYQSRLGEIIIGDIHQIHKRGMYINVDKTEVFLPREEQIFNERLRRGNTIRCLIKEVRNQGRGPEIIVSRADRNFLIRLFELEVPEIYDGIVEIKKVAREAGERSKIAVESIDRRIDPVGACVGMKGIRIQAIVKELNNEKIDVINFSSEPEIYVMRALTPAKPIKVIVNKEDKMAVAVIPDEMMSLAIGRNGVNLRLASELTDYQIEPIRESEYNTESSIDYTTTAIDDIEELADSVKKKLLDAGYESISEIGEIGLDGLKEISGVGPKTAEKIWDVVKRYLDEEDEDE
ncbi:MAG: transcription termination factor NusA [Calditrichae bacterium]|nr:transcription termination factor NusA [Calditrichota bacterium]MCB9057382.1 transcription termination factor NusA [Calditrichia bacterium]